MILAKRRDASAAMKRVDEAGRLLSFALAVAEAMEELEMSMPREDLNREESVIVNRPLPEYASMRCVIL